MIDTTATAPSHRTHLFSNTLCWLAILGIVGFILVKNTRNYQAAADRPLTADVPPPDVSLEITSRMVVGQSSLYSLVPGGTAAISRERDRMLAAIDAAAVTPADKLNAIPVIAELGGTDAAFSRLDRLQPQLTPNPLLAGDAQVLRDIYLKGPKSVSPAQRQGLIERHEWFGQLALAFGLPPDDPQRQGVLREAMRSTIVLGVLSIVLLLALLAGLALFIVGIVFFRKGRMRFNYRPSQALGPPVFLETFALWLILWIAISLALRVSGVQLSIFTTESAVAIFSIAVALWPLWRGVRWAQLRVDLGWYISGGAVKEILAGLGGYLGGLPIVAVGFGITAALIRASNTHPTHPILRQLRENTSALSVLGIYLAACVLAPLIEETMFRGALYGHLRRRHRPIVAAVVVSLLFAAIHPQGWPVIPLLASIAIVLAILREWRGSLLASMTAHGLNNAIGVTIVLLLLR